MAVIAIVAAVMISIGLVLWYIDSRDNNRRIQEQEEEKEQ
jgi:hypothetical protein